MKTFISLPKSDNGQAFYSRYAALIPTLNLLGYLSQIVSAITEFGVIYSIVYASLSVFWPDYAGGIALAGAVVGTAFIELGLRKFLPYSARAVIHRRYKGWDGWITGFILTATVGLITTCGLLSFKGSRALVEAVAPPTVVLTTTATDSTATTQAATALATLERDQDGTRVHYAALIESTEQSAEATIRELDGQLAALIVKEDRTGKRYTTRKGQIRRRIEQTTAERDRKTAQLKADRANALANLTDAHRAKVATIETDQRSRRQKINRSNETAAAELTAKVDSYGGGLAYFTLFCLAVFIVSVIIKELHHAGAEVEERVEPGAFDFEAGPVVALLTALRGRVDRFTYGVIHRIEQGTTDAPEPVAAPTVWGRTGDGLRTVQTEGVERKLKTAKDAMPAAAAQDKDRRAIGFRPHQDKAADATKTPLEEATLTDCVKDANETQPAEHEVGVCDHCGNDYLKRTTWQRFCQTQCRKDHHAQQHDGKAFDPSYKPWNNG